MHEEPKSVSDGLFKMIQALGCDVMVSNVIAVAAAATSKGALSLAMLRAMLAVETVVVPRMLVVPTLVDMGAPRIDVVALSAVAVVVTMVLTEGGGATVPVEFTVPTLVLVPMLVLLTVFTLEGLEVTTNGDHFTSGSQTVEMVSKSVLLTVGDPIMSVMSGVHCEWVLKHGRAS